MSKRLIVRAMSFWVFAAVLSEGFMRRQQAKVDAQYNIQSEKLRIANNLEKWVRPEPSLPTVSFNRGVDCGSVQGLTFQEMGYSNWGYSHRGVVVLRSGRNRVLRPVTFLNTDTNSLVYEPLIVEEE